MKRIVAIAVAGALLTSACSLGARTQAAKLLVSSTKRAAASGTATGTMSFSLVARVEGQAPAGGGAAGLPAAAGAAAGSGAGVTPPPSGELPISLDFAKHRAAVSMSIAGAAPEPVIVLDGTRIFVRRGSTTGISSRRWVKLDLAKVDKMSAPDGNDLPERTGLLLVAFPGPLQLLELLAGSLTGSTRQASPNTYAANVSREKADRELRLDDRAKELRSNGLALVALVDEVHPAVVTLDDQGRPTAFRIRFHPRLRRDLQVVETVDTHLQYQPATVAVPPADDTLTIETQGQLLGELASLGAALAGPKKDGATP